MLWDEYLNTRQQTEHLCEPLTTEDYVPQAVDYASPPKWHLAHVSWFFEEMILKNYLENYQVFDPQYSFLFNSYYQTLGEKALRAERGLITRPTVSQVYSYRQHVDQHMQELINDEENISAELRDLVILGINHEQQHQELFITDLKYVFGLNPIFPVYHQDVDFLGLSHSKENAKETGWYSFSEGVYEVGFQGEGFCFDNELGRHKTYLQNFQIAKNLVTNGEYIEFINAGGYQQFHYWLDEGWTWLTVHHISSPLYWHDIEGEWHQYTLAGLVPVDPDGILTHVSYYEAQAFATWKHCRLPTEFEWEVASGKLNWGLRWEWTSSAYQPYPGFKIGDGAVGEYNGKFMVNQMVLRGASLATAKGHSRSSYRNFFHPHLQWQFSGIRLAK